MKHSSLALSFALLTATSSAVVAATPDQGGSSSTAISPISYAQIIKSMKVGGADSAKTRKLLVGKIAKVNLIATGPQALMVDRKDMIFFHCDKRASGFKGGEVTSKITDFSDEEAVSVSLEKCGK